MFGIHKRHPQSKDIVNVSLLDLDNTATDDEPVLLDPASNKKVTKKD